MTTDTMKESGISDLSGLHLLRFLLAMSILIVHFPHFFFPYAGANTDRSALPFQSYLDPIYSYGGFAVEIFWMISGVIFYVFYMREISDKQISFLAFLGYRLSKLYPLHFVTLLIVTILQLKYYNVHGNTFIYNNNDLTHFILNVLMINFWNAKFGLSFNGPFWSVSVELFVYLVFFIFSWSGMLNTTKNMIYIAALFFIFYSLGILSPFYECLLYFFSGTILAKKMSQITIYKIFLLLFFCMIALMLRHYNPVLQNSFELKRIVDASIKLPMSVFLIAFFIRSSEKLSCNIKHKFMLLGNITYSVYMMHISLQIVLVLLFFDNGIVFFNTIPFFLFYITVSLFFGLLAYNLVELPAQRFFRSYIKHRRVTVSQS